MPGDGPAGETLMLLHGYWRSSAAYRVRIALAVKGVEYRSVTHDLRTGEHHTEAYTALNPQRLVPALEAEGDVLAQSQAIIEWLDERYPDPPLLPADSHGRAVIRAMTGLIASDIHPLNNLRVLNAVRQDFGASKDDILHWIARWIGDGFAALENQIATHGAGFAYGDSVSMADCFLVPQVYSAERFKVDLTPYPSLVAAAAKARGLGSFIAAHPDRQPDADRP
jgi:maleylpyruvate isomerase